MGGLTPGARVLVTGSGGYLGSVLLPRLEATGFVVVPFDAGLFAGCDFGTARPDPPPQDVRRATAALFDGIDAVVHLAALSNDPLGDLDPDLTHAINTLGSLRIARAAKQAGVSRFVFASSCSNYGAAGGDDLLDEDAPLRPVTPYAESKVRTEEALAELADDDFHPVFMRNATAFGVSPRLRLDVVLNNLTAWAHTSGQIRLLSDGRSWRPLVHVADIAAATQTLLTAPEEKVHAIAYNIGALDSNHLVADLARMVGRAYPDCEIAMASGAGPDPRSYRVDFSRFAQAFPDHRFDWTAQAGIEELAAAFTEVGLAADELSGDRYLRLAHLRGLIDSGRVDAELHWTDPSDEVRSR